MVEDSLADEGHEILGPVSSSIAARDLAVAERPDLMLVDIHLDDGETGCLFAREAHENWHIPTIFLTGSPAKARDCDDAIGVLVKPFSPASIGAAVNVAGAIKAGETPPTIPPEMRLF
jgi:DNA-binding response OmpR family regulator